MYHANFLLTDMFAFHVAWPVRIYDTGLHQTREAPWQQITSLCVMELLAIVENSFLYQTVHAILEKDKR